MLKLGISPKRVKEKKLSSMAPLSYVRLGTIDMMLLNIVRKNTTFHQCDSEYLITV